MTAQRAIKGRKAQTFLEYSFLIVVIVGVLLIMQNYVMRSMQGVYKDNTDRLGGEKIAGGESVSYTPGDWYGTSSSVTRAPFLGVRL